VSVARAEDPTVAAVRSLLAGRATLDDPAVRRALELLIVREERRSRSFLGKEEEVARSDAGRNVVARLALDGGAGIVAKDVASAYLFAFKSTLGREDEEAGKAWRATCASAIVMVRREFGGKADEACRYVVRAVRFWKARMDEGRWPGPGAPSFGRMRDARLIAAWRRGEIDEALKAAE